MKPKIQGASGAVAVDNQMLKTRAALGKAIAVQAAAGVDVNTGSNVGAQSAVAETGMADALILRSDTARKAWSYDTQASRKCRNYDSASGRRYAALRWW